MEIITIYFISINYLTGKVQRDCLSCNCLSSKIQANIHLKMKVRGWFLFVNFAKFYLGTKFVFTNSSKKKKSAKKD